MDYRVQCVELHGVYACAKYGDVGGSRQEDVFGVLTTSSCIYSPCYGIRIACIHTGVLVCAFYCPLICSEGAWKAVDYGHGEIMHAETLGEEH